VAALDQLASGLCYGNRLARLVRRASPWRLAASRPPSREQPAIAAALVALLFRLHPTRGVACRALFPIVFKPRAAIGSAAFLATMNRRYDAFASPVYNKVIPAWIFAFRAIRDGLHSLLPL
jgi:hypothetical protein